jgi:membrane-bound lytic murein transglycosylase A
MRFVMLVPKSLDPSARGRLMPVPDARPSEKIAKLFPQTDPLKDQPKDNKNAAATAQPAAVAPAGPPAAQATVAKPVPLPEARPKTAPPAEKSRRLRRTRHVR